MLFAGDGKDLLPRIAKAHLELRLAIPHAFRRQAFPQAPQHEVADDSLAALARLQLIFNHVQYRQFRAVLAFQGMGKSRGALRVGFEVGGVENPPHAVGSNRGLFGAGRHSHDRALGQPKNLQLIDETLNQTLLSVRSDEIRFRQVLLNLLSNAVKFTAHGCVCIRAMENQPEGHLRFEIEDTGIGVPNEKRDVVFEKFVRHDPKALHGVTGSGLGLAIAKRLVEMMSGRIGLETGADGKGSIAWFTLPLAEPRQKQEAKSA